MSFVLELQIKGCVEDVAIASEIFIDNEHIDIIDHDQPL